jgi:putative oxidoreductase
MRRRTNQMQSGSMDAAILMVRCSVGLVFLVHGANKFVGKGGIVGTGRWFEGLGLRPGIVHAWLAALTEAGVGIALLLGILFPLSCTAAVSLMTVASLTDHRGKGFFVFRGGWEYAALIAVISTSLALSGPGRISVDRTLHWTLGGPAWASVCALFGAVVGCAFVQACRTGVDTR